MKRVFNIVLCAILGLGVLSLATLPSYAQMEDDYSYTYDDDLYWDWDSDWDYEWSTGTSYDASEELGALLGGGAMVLGGLAFVFSLAMSLGLYIFSALALMSIAKKLDHPNGWFAWIPILNAILLFQMGDKSPWLLLLAFIPIIGGLAVMILSIIALMNICEKRGYDKLLGLLALIPVANLVLLGILAWGKKSTV